MKIYFLWMFPQLGREVARLDRAWMLLNTICSGQGIAIRMCEVLEPVKTETGKNGDGKDERMQQAFLLP